MAMVWKVIAVNPADAEEGTGTWEPFAVSCDEEGNEVVLCKGMFEDEGERSSTLPENMNWAGNEPDVRDMEVDEGD